MFDINITNVPNGGVDLPDRGPVLGMLSVCMSLLGCQPNNCVCFQMSSSPLSKKRRVSDSETKTGSHCSSSNSVRTELSHTPTNVRTHTHTHCLSSVSVTTELSLILLG